MNLWIVYIIQLVSIAIVLWVLRGIELKLEDERGLTELTEEDRNLLRRVSRLLEENTSAQRKGRP